VVHQKPQAVAVLVKYFKLILRRKATEHIPDTALISLGVFCTAVIPVGTLCLSFRTDGYWSIPMTSHNTNKLQVMLSAFWEELSNSVLEKTHPLVLFNTCQSS
jgi:hypothetical protein